MGLLPEKKILNVPELVERLFLGFTSAFHMDHPQLVNKQSISSKAWRNLVKESSCGGEQLEELKEKQKKSLKALVAILKLMQTGLRMRAKMGGKVNLTIGIDKLRHFFLHPPSECKFEMKT